jgi:uncharacterized protein
MAPQLSEVRARLLEILPELQAKYPLKHLWIFGSVARGEATENSDVDILVEYVFDNLTTYSCFLTDIEKSIGFNVDIVRDKYLNKHVKQNILLDRVQLL